jgi:hypothetical protein
MINRSQVPRLKELIKYRLLSTGLTASTHGEGGLSRSAIICHP